MMMILSTLDRVREESPPVRTAAEGLYCQSYATCLFHITVSPW